MAARAVPLVSLIGFGMARVLIAGCGYAGTALGLCLADKGHQVWGLRRRAQLLPAGIEGLKADLTVAGTLCDLPVGLDFVFYVAAADRSDDEAYRCAYVDGLKNLINALWQGNQQLQRLFFTSSTAVYAQSSGEWVDETSPAESSRFSGKRLLEAERIAFDSPYPATVLRLAGIYGPSRTGLLERARRGKGASSGEQPHYTNRIHRDDCTGVLQHLMDMAKPEALYLGVDHEPAEVSQVLNWLATKLCAPQLSTDESFFSEERFRSSKRCSNARLLASGYVFRYPTYREGYSALLSER